MTIWPFVLTSLVVGWVPCGALTVSPITNLTGWLGKPFSPSYPRPSWVLTIGKSFPEMLHSFRSSSGLLDTVLWVRVFIILYLAERWWWLSHCRYWSVWVGFLYTVIDSLPSASGLDIGVQEVDREEEAMALQELLNNLFTLWSITQH